MHDHVFRVFSCFLVAASVFLPASALDVPLSDEAIREAYFLGQRHDASLLGNYIKFLPPPKTGPHISSVTILTPFVQLAQLSDRHLGSYSAQQARLDHLGQEEIVEIIIEIRLTPSYGAFISSPSSSRSSSPSAFTPRSSLFWKDFQVQIYDGDRTLSPSDFDGHANHSCGRRGPCVMTGATLKFKFPANAFTSDSTTIHIDLPEGDPVSVDFDLIGLR
jgi:hypothetical protein